MVNQKLFVFRELIDIMFYVSPFMLPCHIMQYVNVMDLAE